MIELALDVLVIINILIWMVGFIVCIGATFDYLTKEKHTLSSEEKDDV